MRIHFALKTHLEDPASRKQALAWAETNIPEIGPDILIPGIGPAWNDEADYAVYLAWARIQLLLGQPEKVLEVTRPMLKVAEQQGLIHRIIELSLIQAQAFFVSSRKDLSLPLLRNAVAHAEKNGYLRLLDQNPILVRMLKEPIARELSPGYIRKILEINGGASDPATLASSGNSQSGKDDQIEPLSSREKDVLKLMADGLSNPEIAARLYLSPNTLKAHTQHIFGKLGVHNRVQAINKARELKIVH
jgi:LuxR family maltose regulon positive regulatory protein